MEIENIGEEKMPSILKDPFKNNCVKRVYVSFSELFNSSWGAYGEVEFSNGGTSGKQTFKGDSFDEVVLKIKTFMKNLE